MVSGMPPEKRGLISKTLGEPSTIRHWMFTGPANLNTSAHASARAISARILDGPAAVDDAGADHHPLARHDGQRPAVEVAEQVERELRAVEVLLHDRRRTT